MTKQDSSILEMQHAVIYGLCQVASVMSNYVRHYELQPARLLCPWDSPGKNIRVGCCFFLQGDLPNPGIKWISPLSPALAGGFFTTSATWAAPKILSRGTQYFFSLCSFWLAYSASRQEGNQGIAYNLNSLKFQNLLNKSLMTMIIGFLFLVSFHCKTSLQGVQKV